MQSVNHEQTHEEMSWTVQIRRIVLTMLAALLGVAAGLGALVGTAAITGRPPMFLLSGLAAFCAAYFLGILLATRGISSCNRQRVRTILFWVGTAVLVGVFVWTALLHMDDRRLPPASVAGQRFWELPTGSRISYVRVPAEGPARTTSVVFLDGGPGVPDLRGDSEYFGRLARDGFDVYVYDEVGTGRSSRLVARYQSRTTNPPELIFSALVGDHGARKVRFERAAHA